MRVRKVFHWSLGERDTRCVPALAVGPHPNGEIVPHIGDCDASKFCLDYAPNVKRFAHHPKCPYSSDRPANNGCERRRGTSVHLNGCVKVRHRIAGMRLIDGESDSAVRVNADIAQTVEVQPHMDQIVNPRLVDIPTADDIIDSSTDERLRIEEPATLGSHGRSLPVRRSRSGRTECSGASNAYDASAITVT